MNSNRRNFFAQLFAAAAAPVAVRADNGTTGTCVCHGVETGQRTIEELLEPFSADTHEPPNWMRCVRAKHQAAVKTTDRAEGERRRWKQ